MSLVDAMAASCLACLGSNGLSRCCKVERAAAFQACDSRQIETCTVHDVGPLFWKWLSASASSFPRAFWLRLTPQSSERPDTQGHNYLQVVAARRWGAPIIERIGFDAPASRESHSYTSRCGTQIIPEVCTGESEIALRSSVQANQILSRFLSLRPFSVPRIHSRKSSRSSISALLL